MTTKRGAHDFQVGDRVKLTGKFLRNTGQSTGGEGQSVWTVQGFDRDWVVTDEATDTTYFTPEELAADPTLKFRRIAAGNLYRVGTLSSRNCP